jgi:hypothetical protein
MSRGTNRTIRGFVTAVQPIANAKTISFRKQLVPVTITFRDIAAATPGNAWRWFPLTSNVLETGSREDWHRAIADYAAIVQSELNKLAALWEDRWVLV